jgi:hypothetical protein
MYITELLTYSLIPKVAITVVCCYQEAPGIDPDVCATTSAWKTLGGMTSVVAIQILKEAGM